MSKDLKKVIEKFEKIKKSYERTLSKVLKLREDALKYFESLGDYEKEIFLFGEDIGSMKEACISGKEHMEALIYYAEALQGILSFKRSSSAKKDIEESNKFLEDAKKELETIDKLQMIVVDSFFNKILSEEEIATITFHLSNWRKDVYSNMIEAEKLAFRFGEILGRAEAILALEKKKLEILKRGGKGEE